MNRDPADDLKLMDALQDASNRAITELLPMDPVDELDDPMADDIDADVAGIDDEIDKFALGEE